MNTFLVILLVAAMIATVVALVRGVVNFMRNADAEVRGTGPSEASIRSNKLMQARIFFQAIAILIVVLILFAAGHNG
ncbi:twin transmembrane helix small protein [Hephaestia mangrovi]|uniref:twin transmembrane helix small protein n=1 Tax=Hephaestia mangrovi TaxID=2873268 RepID=UPI001CA612CF|nr:twin transmembrane helix small protein [Hephaestia mangrovi]